MLYLILLSFYCFTDIRTLQQEFTATAQDGGGSISKPALNMMIRNIRSGL